MESKHRYKRILESLPLLPPSELLATVLSNPRLLELILTAIRKLDVRQGTTFYNSLCSRFSTQVIDELIRRRILTDNPPEFKVNKFPKPGAFAPRRQRKRLGLPLLLCINSREELVVACPDSGSDDNIMSRDVADQLGLPITNVQDLTLPTFVIANGRKVSAVGQVRIECAFKQGSPATSHIDCVFYVFQTLAVPMIMGAEFLHATETLTKHRDRLVEELIPSKHALRVYSVGRTKRDVVCRVGNYLGCATADTGSDLDLVSQAFAGSRAFDVEDSCLELEFADGSTGCTRGVIKTDLSIGRVSDVKGFIPSSQKRFLELFVLDNLNADIIVGADTIQDLQVFSGREDCFIPAIPYLGESNLNIIRYIGAVERGFSKAWECVKDPFISSEKKQAATKSMSSFAQVYNTVLQLTIHSCQVANGSDRISMTSYYMISSIIESVNDP
ncbi:hypothetical protein F5883DRAFT_554941 [Diaporthe sp. PMI_573]|nr:hypothetical protein F5883DRAFT_554941 [Diaporthaceae sp. PMI_573]